VAIKNALAAFRCHMRSFVYLSSGQNIEDQVREMRGERCEKSWQQLVERAIDTFECEFINMPSTCH